MEDSEDIYADLPNFSFSATQDELQTTNNNLREEIVRLNNKLIEITNERDEYQAKCTVVAKNISSLLKTAQSEISRKDRLINELRSELNTIRPQNSWKRKLDAREKLRSAKKRNQGFIAKRDRSPLPAKEYDKPAAEDKNVMTECNKTFVANNDLSTDAAISNRFNGNKFQSKNVALPEVKCKTVYSQRMFNRLKGLPVHNGAKLDVQKESIELTSISENNSNRNSIEPESKSLLGSKNDDLKFGNELLNGCSTNVEVANTSTSQFPNNKQNQLTNSHKHIDLLIETNFPAKDNVSKAVSSNDSKVESSKFLRPDSSIVVKKHGKKVISPISSSWNGLVKTVNQNKSCEQVVATETIAAVNPSSEVMLHTSPTPDDENDLKDQTSQDKNINKCTRNSLLEHLFGSPVKWGDSSNESVPNLDLSSPTIYEDSCSAQIENANFNLGSGRPPLQRIATSLPVPLKKDNFNKKESLVQHIPEKEKTLSSLGKWTRAFENIGEKKQKMKSIFSPLRSDSCKSTGNLTLNKGSSVELIVNFPFKSKYEDSVLGQFDDTTQFVSALTKMESKLSPLNTPVKTISSKPATEPSISDAKPLVQNTFPQLQKTSAVSILPLSGNKNLSDKPINILYPRKTPRIVTYNKIQVEKIVDKPTPLTPNKNNRFAINDSFISQQEEKVRRNRQNNVNDPIAITISAKNKDKCKESDQHVTGKGFQTHFPKKPKTISACLRKKKGNVAPTSSQSRENLLNGSLAKSEPNYFTEAINSHNPKVHVDVSFEGQQSFTDKGVVFQDKSRSQLMTICDDQVLNQNEKLDTVAIVELRTAYNNSEGNQDEAIDNGTSKVDYDTVLKSSSTTTTNNNYNDYRRKSQENLGKNLCQETISKLTTDENHPLHKEFDISNHLKAEDSVISKIIKPILNCKSIVHKVRVQNFRPSSQLKKTNRISQLKNPPNSLEIKKNISSDFLSKNSSIKSQGNAVNEIFPVNFKTNDEMVVTSKFDEKLNHIKHNHYNTSTPKIEPRPSHVIVRSSKKPEFASATLLVGDCKSTTLIQPRDNSHKKNVNEATEIREWKLKPITFDSDYRSRKVVDPIQSALPGPNKVEPRIPSQQIHDSTIHLNLLKSSKDINLLSTGKIIRGRRPLNFGVKVNLD